LGKTKNNMQTRKLFLGAIACFLAAFNAHAVLVQFTDKATYQAAVGPHQTITFVGLADGTVLGSQYSGQGVTFTDGDDTALTDPVFGDDIFVTDDAGAFGSFFNGMTLKFSTPINHIGVDFPGALKIQLYSGATLVGTSQDFGGSGEGFFGGVLDHGITFDTVVLTDWLDDAVFVDNLYFGLAAVPEPSTYLAGALLALVFGLHGVRSLRRRKQTT
jgi:hypothetical protein